MFDVVVVGSLNMDLVAQAERFPDAGETVSGSGFFTVSGGKGANQAVAAGRLGARTAMVGCVGRDPFAAELLRSLSDSLVDISHVTQVNGASGVALIEVDPQGRNRIVVVPGANGLVTPEVIRGAAEVIRQARILLVQLEIPMDSVQRAVEIAHAANVKVLLDPAPAPVNPLTSDLLGRVGLLAPNEHEAAVMLGVKRIEPARAQEAAAALRRLGPKGVILKLGALGAYLLTDEFDGFIPGIPVETVDTTAAGDTFAGALASALVRGRSLPAAVQFAHQAAAISVTRLGAQSSMPWLQEVES